MPASRLLAAGLSLLLTSVACGYQQAATARAAAGRAAVAPAAAVLRPVQGQVDAYNAHDLERFLSYYSPDVLVHLLERDSASIVRGKDAMRGAFDFLRRAPPGFRAEVLDRMVAGRFVIDHERVLTPGQSSIEAIAIYEVADSVITRVWLLPTR